MWLSFFAARSVAMHDALAVFTELTPNLPLTLEVRVSSGLLLAGLLALWLWRGRSGRR